MKRLNKHPFIFIAFVIFAFFSTASSAQDPSQSDIQQVEDNINGIMDFPVRTSGENMEYAHLWFKQILGGFIFAPWDAMGIAGDNYDIEDQTVLAKALGFTNILAIIICLVVGYYLIVGGAINTAAKGEVLGSNWDGPWLAIRTSIGFGMLIPLKGIGGMTLSFSQIAVIWLIMIGSNAATLLWNMVGESIVTGTEIVQSNITPGFSDVAALATMVSCADLSVMAKSKNYDGPNNASGKRQKIAEDGSRILVEIGYASGNPDYTMAPPNKKHRIFYDSSYWEKSNKIEANESREISYITFGPTDGDRCGTINIPSNKGGKVAVLGDDWEEVDATSYKKEALIAGAQAYADIIIDTSNELNAILKQIHPEDDELISSNINEALSDPDIDDDDLREAFDEFYKDFVKIAENYVNRVSTEIYEKSIGSDAFMKKVKEDMMYGGWAGAGIWFIELSTIPSIPYQAYNSVQGSISFSDGTVCSEFFEDSQCENLTEANGAARNIIGEVLRLATGDNSLANPQDSAHSVCNSRGECMSPDEVASRTSIQVSQAILGFLGSNNEEAMNPFDDDTSLVSPFLFLNEMGQTMNEAAYAMIGGVVIINTIMDYVQGLKKAGNETILGWAAKLSGANVYKHLIFGFFTSFAKSAAMVAVAGLVAAAMIAMTSGFVLAYVIPFMPITTWILMMAGYMLTVVESIAAAPLAIVLLFTPEGSGIAGSRFERALNLVAMAILRPSFMILGLVAAITVSFVAFGMMNTFFFKAAEHILTGHLFDAIAIMLIYVSMSYQLAKMMVENMHQLPDRIGEWFAGGVSRQFGESRVNDSAEQSVQQAAGQFKGLPSSIMGMQSAMRETKAGEDQARSKEDQARNT